MIGRFTFVSTTFAIDLTAEGWLMAAVLKLERAIGKPSEAHTLVLDATTDIGRAIELYAGVAPRAETTR